MKIHPTYRVPLLIAVLLHVALLVAFTINMVHTHYRWHDISAAQTVVQAKTVDQKQLDMAIKQVQREQTAQQRAEQNRLHQIKQQALQAKQERVKEQRRLEEYKQHQLALQQKQAEEQKQAEQKASQLKQQIKEMRLKKLSEQQNELQDKLLQQQLKSDQQKIAQQQTAQQQKQQSEQHAAEMQGVLDKYRAQIMQAIQSNWHPVEQNSKLFCQILVHVGPGGVVTGIELIQSSGDAVLDRSARVAILKSSPLPVPTEAALFDQFRSLRIKMSPQEIKGMT